MRLRLFGNLIQHEGLRLAEVLKRKSRSCLRLVGRELMQCRITSQITKGHQRSREWRKNRRDQVASLDANRAAPVLPNSDRRSVGLRFIAVNSMA